MRAAEHKIEEQGKSEKNIAEFVVPLYAAGVPGRAPWQRQKLS